MDEVQQGSTKIDEDQQGLTIIDKAQRGSKRLNKEKSQNFVFDIPLRRCFEFFWPSTHFIALGCLLKLKSQFMKHSSKKPFEASQMVQKLHSASFARAFAKSIFQSLIATATPFAIQAQNTLFEINKFFSTL